MNFIAVVYFQNGFEEIFLPNIDNTAVSFSIPVSVSSFRGELNLAFEVWDSVWSLRSSDEVDLYVDSRRVSFARLGKGGVILGRVRFTDENFSVMVNENFDNYTNFKKYIFDRDVSIGSGADNTVRFNANNLVSGSHAALAFAKGGACFLTDLNSRNGTFLNGQRVTSRTELAFGDVVYIVGLKIVYLRDILAVSTPYGNVSVRDLSELAPDPADEREPDAPAPETFTRPPRQIEKIDDAMVEIEAPPTVSKRRRQPLALIIGPSFTMIIPMLAGLLFMMAVTPPDGGVNQYMFMGIVISGVAAIVGIFWALMNYYHTRGGEAEEESARSDQYMAYIGAVTAGLEEKRDYNKSVLMKSYPSVARCVNWLDPSASRLWERGSRHDDFLCLRLGYADIPFPNEIRVPRKSVAAASDDLAQIPERVKRDFSVVKNAPITLDLVKRRLVGVTSRDRRVTLEIGRALSVQLALSHAYTEARMAFVYDESDKDWFGYAKWLPHVWNEENDMRMLAVDRTSASDVFYYLNEVAKARSAEHDNRPPRGSAPRVPRYVVFVASAGLAANEPAFRALVSAVSGADVGISIVMLTNQIDRLPAECSVVIDEQDQYLRMLSVAGEFPAAERIAFDRLDSRSAYSASLALSGRFLNETDSKSGLPKTATFLDVFGADDADGLDIYRRWLQNRSFEGMRAAVGVDGSGKTFYLDIHEKHHGPHGLVAGTTGSGKSEFLQSYILSMALNYHPNEAAFLLIDYKGGGMAGFFENLPHTSGVITNLDGNQTSRALASIKAEIANRQRVFKSLQVRHIDEYIELFRLSKVSEPMPHLIIIADEFAELKKDNPDFIRELISASRVGRSLGVHLILATQQPSAAVDGEIRANSKFGVCLRVNDKHESISMVGRADASLIQPSQIGRGFFQVGNDDIFEEFQSAWSGAPYSPGARGDGVSSLATMINLQGKPRVVKRAPERGKGETEITAVVNAIISTAAANGVGKVRGTWLAPLPKTLALDAAAPIGGDGLCAALGLSDEPALQRQSPVVIDLTRTGHVLICGAPLSGKTTLMETILTSLVTSYPPDRLNIYIADYNSRLLSAFSPAPHTGGVTFDGDPDRAVKLVKMALGILSERKRLFAEKGVGTYRDYLRADASLPAVILAFDGLPEFIGSNQNLDDAVAALAKDGASHGMYIVASCGGMNEVKGRLKNYFTFNIGLGLADKFEYSQTLGERCEIAAEKNIPGRGMIRYPAPVEFQTATPVAAAPERLSAELTALVKSLSGKYGAKAVKRIPSVPERPDYDSFTRDFSAADVLGIGKLPLGYDLDEAEIVSIDLTRTYCYTICGQQRVGKTNALKLLLRLCASGGADTALFGDAPSLAAFAESFGVGRRFSGADGLYKFAREVLIPEFTARANPSERVRPLFVFIHDLIGFGEAIYNDEYPMRDFFESIFNTGSGLNIYFVGELLVTGVNDRIYPAAVRNFLSWETGVHLGGRTGEQNLYDFDTPLSETVKKLPAGTGFTIIGDKTVKIKIPFVHTASG